MIYINQGQSNNVLVTCSRNKSLTGNVFYLWTVRHKLSQQAWKFLPYKAPNITPYEPSKDLFFIDIIDSSPQVLIGTSGNTANVHMIPGEYYLKIYEQLSSTNLNPQLAYDVVYEGTITVNSSNPIGEIDYSGLTDTVIIYQQ